MGASTRTAAAPLKLLSVASEAVPLLKTGGLADVVGALPAALAPHGVAVRTLLPGHPSVTLATPHAKAVCDWPDFFGGPARVLAARHGAIDLLVLEAPHLYGRPGNPYVDAQGHDWPDNARRYAALASAAARLGSGALPSFVPDVLHAHDWQAALAPAYLHYRGDRSDPSAARRPATVLTVHNLAFQGRFGAEVWSGLGLPDEAFAPDGLEFHGDVGYLKAGLLLADAVTTVSPTYAREILTPAGGMGLDGLLRWRGPAVSGIVNGIDTEAWNPATDTHLVRTYDAADLDARAHNRREVEARFGLPAHDSPLVCMVSRLTGQKGIDLVVAGLDAIVAGGVRLVVLGTGEAALEGALHAAARRHPTRVAVRIGYDEGLSHLLQGGCDAILVPSRFEPCGLTQLYGLRYGCVPVVSRVGGLADTVIDANDAALKAGVATGLQFSDVTVDGVVDAVLRMAHLHRQPALWRAMQQAGMRGDVSWRSSAGAYAALYKSLVSARRAAV